MPIIQGFTRARKHQFGRQTDFGTKVAAKRAYPFRGIPAPNLNWTDQDVDAGSIDTVASPFRGIPDLQAQLTIPALAYNDLPLLLSGSLGGGVTPTGGGAAKTWAYDPASEAPLDDFDPMTYEFGDDVTSDWYQFGDSIIEKLEITGPEGLGALTVSAQWRLGSIASTGSTDSPVTGTVPTPGLNVDTDAAIVYLKDGAIYLSDSPYDLDANQISDALHNFVLRIPQPADQKRFANGTQSFDVSAYGRQARIIEMECTFAKTDDTVGTGSESDAWLSDLPVNRYLKMAFESTVDAQTSTPYSWQFTLPIRYYTRTEGNQGGNTVITLLGRAFFDPDEFGGVFKSTVVNTLTSGAF